MFRDFLRKINLYAVNVYFLFDIEKNVTTNKKKKEQKKNHSCLIRSE